MVDMGRPSKKPTKRILKELILKFFDWQIAEQYGVDRVTVYNWKKSYGLIRGGEK